MIKTGKIYVGTQKTTKFKMYEETPARSTFPLMMRVFPTMESRAEQ
jgi:hypothetical protein